VREQGKEVEMKQRQSRKNWRRRLARQIERAEQVRVGSQGAASAVRRIDPAEYILPQPKPELHAPNRRAKKPHPLCLTDEKEGLKKDRAAQWLRRHQGRHAVTDVTKNKKGR
jgi:hypothetical protein